MGRVLGDRARAAVAVRQRRAGESRGAPRAGAVARRPRRVGARARHDLPALHIANHLMFPAGAETYDAVMKVFRHVYRTDILQPLVVALFLFQIGTGLFFAWR